MTGGTRTPLQAVGLVVAVTVATSAAMAVLGVPSAVLFGAVLGGMAHALTSPLPLDVPTWAFRVAQGLIGITVGALVDLTTLGRMADESLSILAVTLGTLVISIGAGLVLGLRS